MGGRTLRRCSLAVTRIFGTLFLERARGWQAISTSPIRLCHRHKRKSGKSLASLLFPRQTGPQCTDDGDRESSPEQRHSLRSSNGVYVVYLYLSISTATAYIILLGSLPLSAGWPACSRLKTAFI
uniref:Uncharacterized protein n=1 Tax=Plectus sambesii TaxID=2011161 RepID=A0A914VI43_9BILA